MLHAVCVDWAAQWIAAPMKIQFRAHRRSDVTLAVAIGMVVMVLPARAVAQVTLLVSEGAATPLDVEPGIADGLRQGLGVSVRRVEPSLDDLALAAGCMGSPRAPACIARIAHASGARLVAVERVSHGPRGYRVEVELRRGEDGRSLRTLRLRCASSAECGDAVLGALEGDFRAALGNDPVASAAIAARDGARSTGRRGTTDLVEPRVEAVQPDRPSQVRRSVPMVSQVLFAASIASSLGAMIGWSVGVGVQQSRDTVAGIRTSDQSQRLSELDTSRDWAIGVGTAFALVGACLAAAGAVTMVLSPRRATVHSSLRPSVRLDGSTAMLVLDATF